MQIHTHCILHRQPDGCRCHPVAAAICATFILICLGISLLANGCVPREQKPEQLCPSKRDFASVKALLAARAQQAGNLFAKGDVVYRSKEEGRKSGRATIISVPPDNLFLQGSLTVGPPVVQLGSNAKEFWYIQKPNYFWGNWNDQTRKCVERFWFGPALWRDILAGPVPDSNENWHYIPHHGYDVLELRSPGGGVTKRVTLYNCDYSVRKLEYYDSRGLGIITASLSEYVDVQDANGRRIPGHIEITTGPASDSIQSMEITVKSATSTVKPAQHQLFDVRPPAKSDHIAELGPDCEFHEVKQ